MTNFNNQQLNPSEHELPLFIGAGVYKESRQLAPLLLSKLNLTGLLITLGAFTNEKWAGNAKNGDTDFIYYPDRKMAGNAIGLRNPGREGIVNLGPAIKQLGQVGIKTIIQIANLPQEDPMRVVPQLAEIAATMEPAGIEINLSCPNGKRSDGSLHEPIANSTEASLSLVAVTRAAIGNSVCLGIKDSPHVENLEDAINVDKIVSLATSLSQYIDFVTGINTIGNQSFAEITCTNGKGGMSGPVVADISKQHLRLWHELSPDLPYLSCGGVDSTNVRSELAERKSLGATRVGGVQDFYRTTDPLLQLERWINNINR